LRVKDAEILDLNERVEELSNDLRDARENYNNLEKKLEQLI
jgi:signal transduction histidine kinase